MAAPEATAWLKAKLQAAMGSEKGLVEPVMKSAAAQVTATCRRRLAWRNHSRCMRPLRLTQQSVRGDASPDIACTLDRFKRSSARTGPRS